MTAVIQARPDKIAATALYWACGRCRVAAPNKANADSIPNIPIVL